MEVNTYLNKNISFLTPNQVCEILSSHGLYESYTSMTSREQELFMDFCTGKSLKLLTYDSIFKHIFDPTRNQKRLEHFLSSILGFDVKVLKVLPTESERLAESGSLLVLDIIVRLNDGSIVNVEMQKRPYMFSGERESCYLSDMIMRQYNFKKNRHKELYPHKVFDYSEMRPVYTIIFIEKSYYDFIEYDHVWKHTGKITFDTGISLNYLENVTYIILDNFRNLEQNIDTELKRWIYLLSADTPERILKAATLSDELFDVVSDVSQFCINIDEVMNMFSKALREMDRNTELLMLDLITNELEEKKVELEDTKAELDDAKAELDGTKAELDGTKAELDSAKALHQTELNAAKAEYEAELTRLKDTIKRLEEEAALNK